MILNGFHDGSALRAILPVAPRLRWVHALSAGVEKVLSPELMESPVPLTNGRGVFGPALAEFAMASMLFFAKDLRRLIRHQEAARWEQFEVRSCAIRCWESWDTAESDGKPRGWPTRSGCRLWPFGGARHRRRMIRYLRALIHARTVA